MKLRLIMLVAIIVNLFGPFTPATAMPIAEAGWLPQPSSTLSEYAPATATLLPNGVKPQSDVTNTLPLTTTEMPADWMSGITQDIQQSEYAITWQDHTYLADVAAAYQAPNRSQNLRSYFTADGVRVIPRTEVTPTWEVGLSLVGVGQATKMQAVTSAELTASANRVDLKRGNITEWFVNDERGLEHGFTVAAPPEARLDTEELVLNLRVTGNLMPAATDDETTVELVDARQQPVLRYADLRAYDATGRQLPGRFLVGEAKTDLQIVIATAGATYPITIDPTITGLSTTANWSTSGSQYQGTSNVYGLAISTAGDINGDGYADVIVGIPYYDASYTDEGRVWVYYGSASGLTYTPWITDGKQTSAQFGYAVSTAGDVNGDGYADVIVGARGYSNGETSEGRAYVYLGSSIGLNSTPNWSFESNQVNANLGRSVATAGDVNGDGYSDVIIGAPYFTNGQSSEGRAYAFYGSASGLNTAVDWMAEGNQTNAQYGYSVSTAGDVDGDGHADVIVGTQGVNRAYFYPGSDSGLSPSDTWYTTFGGNSVGTAGDVNGDGYSDVIVNYAVFYGTNTGPSASQSWQGPSLVTTVGDINGDGYSDVTVNGQYYQGSATGLGISSGQSTWCTGGLGLATVETAGDVNNDGYTDALAGCWTYSYYYSSPYYYYTNYWMVSSFHGSSSGLSTSKWSTSGSQGNAQLGYSVNTAGDMNGDGYADVIIGAPLFDTAAVDAGRVFVYQGSPTGTITTPAWTADGIQVGEQFGAAVGMAGDMNGDGYSDVVIGAPYYDSAQADAGRAFVFNGSQTGLNPSVSWFADGDQAGAKFGAAVGTAGDVNGDGYADLLIGSPLYDAAGGLNDAGRAVAYHGAAVGLSVAPNWSVDGAHADAQLGYALGTAGDVNRDGYADVIVGVPFYDGGQTDEGRTLVYHGSALGLSASANWTSESNKYWARYGSSVSAAGDLNGDGFADIVIGAPYYDGGQANEGRVYVYNGATTGIVNASVWTIERDVLNNYLGTSVSTAGDINGDGLADLVIGAANTFYTYLGAPSGLNFDFTDALGPVVGSAGDVNGDGYADVIVGAPLTDYSAALTDTGMVNVYYGNGLGVALRPRQLQADGLAPIAPQGRSNSSSAVQLRVLGRTPLGRGDVKLQWQVVPIQTPFTATNAITGTSVTWTDVITAGVVITQNVTGLEPGSDYTWRVRLLYPTGNRLGQTAGRWISLPWNSWSQKRFHTNDAEIQNLTANNSGPTTLGYSTVLTASVGSGSAVTYAWTFGDGATGIGKVVTHTYAAIGTVTATVTATNSLGTASANTVVNVIDIPIVGLAGQGNSPVTLGETSRFTATIGAGTNVEYAWNFGDGATGTGATPTHMYGDVGLYTATVTATNPRGSVTTTAGVQILDVPIGGLEATSNSPTLLGNLTACTATITAGTGVTYTWNFGDGATGSGASASHVYSARGSYTAIVTATNPRGSITTTTNAQILDVPIAGLAASNNSPTALSSPTMLTATIGSGTTVVYAWDFGDGMTGSGATPAHTYAALGAYTATITATNSRGSANVSTRVDIIDVPLAGLSIVSNSPTTLGAVTLLTASLTAGTNATYLWTFGDGLTNTGQSVSHLYGSIGAYPVSVTATNPRNTAVASATVQVRDVPIAGLSAHTNGPVPLGAAMTLSATLDAGTNVAYVWDLGDGYIDVGQVVTHTYTASGLYTATVAASNPRGTVNASTAAQVLDVPIAGLSAQNSSPTWVGNSTFLTATATAGTNVAYAWDFGDGEVGVGATVAHTYPARGMYIATVTAANGRGQANTTTIVQVVDVPIGGLGINSNSPTELGSATDLTATISAGTGITYVWNLGDGSTAMGSTAAHVYATVGSYPVVVTATNSRGVVTATKAIQVMDVPIAGLTATSSSPSNFGRTTTFTATTTAGTHVNYAWQFGDGQMGNGAVVTHTYGLTGTFMVTVTATNSRGSVEATTSAQVNLSIVHADFSATPQTGEAPLPVAFTNEATGDYVSVLWKFGDGQTSTLLNPTHVYAPGDYTVTLTITGFGTSDVMVRPNYLHFTRKPTVIYLPIIANRWPPVPYNPMLIAIGNADGDGSYDVSWTEQPTQLAETYTLQEATNAAFTTGLREVCTTYNWTCTVDGKLAGTYYYRVRGYNVWGYGGWSTVQSAVVSKVEMIINGGFESGPPAAPWVQSSNAGELIDSLGARTGNWGIYMGGVANASDQIYQQVTVPANAPSPRLAYWRLIRTSDSTTTAYDEMRCVIWDTSGNVLAYCGQFSNVSQSQNWVYQTYDMSAFKGQTVKVAFKAFNDSAYSTQFFVDDVSLLPTATVAQAGKLVMADGDQNGKWQITEGMAAVQSRRDLRRSAVR